MTCVASALMECESRERCPISIIPTDDCDVISSSLVHSSPKNPALRNPLSSRIPTFPVIFPSSIHYLIAIIDLALGICSLTSDPASIVITPGLFYPRQRGGLHTCTCTPSRDTPSTEAELPSPHSLVLDIHVACSVRSRSWSGLTPSSQLPPPMTRSTICSGA